MPHFASIVGGYSISYQQQNFWFGNIRKIGTVVYLHSPFDEILKAIQRHPNAKKKIKKRPLLQDLDTARKLFKQRVPLYRDIADIEIKVKGKSIEKITAEICKKAGIK